MEVMGKDVQYFLFSEFSNDLETKNGRVCGASHRKETDATHSIVTILSVLFLVKFSTPATRNGETESIRLRDELRLYLSCQLQT